MNLPLYTPGYELQENEFLLKIRDRHRVNGTIDPMVIPDGFLTKLTKKGEIPVKFDDWGSAHYNNYERLPIYVHTETYRSGWVLKSWRIGQSQEWAKLIHPDGFTIEIYLDNFLEIALNNSITYGEIHGEFMWKENRLIEKRG